MRILLADDETERGTWLTKALGLNDFQVDGVNDGAWCAAARRPRSATL